MMNLVVIVIVMETVVIVMITVMSQQPSRDLVSLFIMTIFNITI
jgi:hypothetical protein